MKRRQCSRGFSTCSLREDQSISYRRHSRSSRAGESAPRELKKYNDWGKSCLRSDDSNAMFRKTSGPQNTHVNIISVLTDYCKTWEQRQLCTASQFHNITAHSQCLSQSRCRTSKHGTCLQYHGTWYCSSSNFLLLKWQWIQDKQHSNILIHEDFIQCRCNLYLVVHCCRLFKSPVQFYSLLSKLDSSKAALCQQLFSLCIHFHQCPLQVREKFFL